MANNPHRTQHVCYIGNDSHIHEIGFAFRVGWKHTNLGALLRTPQPQGKISGYSYSGDNSQHIILRSNDGQIHELYHVTEWRHVDLGRKIGAPMAAGNPFGYEFPGDNSQHIVYRGNDNHIHELYFIGGKGWKHADLTTATHAPLSANDPIAYYYPGDNSQHIVYLTEDGNIQELYFGFGKGWKHANLTAALRATPAMGIPTGYFFAKDNSQHIVYRGNDNQIHELYFLGGKGWKHANLTAATNSVAPAGDPIGYTYPVDNSQHVIYRCNGNNIHELYFRFGVGWKHANLTTGINAPPAAGDPVGYSFSGDNSQHVMYRGHNGHINELYFLSGKGWHHADLTAVTRSPIAISGPIGYTHT